MANITIVMQKIITEFEMQRSDCFLLFLHLPMLLKGGKESFKNLDLLGTLENKAKFNMY
jgi:hypothetical protein